MADAETTKKCTACREVKPLAEFSTYPDKRSGKRYPHPKCRPCKNAGQRAAYEANPQYHRDAVKASYEKHRERVKARVRKYYWDNHGEMLARRKRPRPVLSPDQIARQIADRQDRERDYMRQYGRAYRTANPHYFRATSAKYRLANVELTRERVEAWRKANPEKHVAKEQRRRARKAAAGGSVTGEQIAAMVEAQRGKCWYCTEPFGSKYHVDHRIPLARGGSGGVENLVIACATCNLRKGARTPQEFAGMLF